VDPTDGKCITRDNADIFLLDQIHELTMLTKNLTQIKDTIQFYAYFHEYPPPAPRFKKNLGLHKNFQSNIVEKIHVIQ